MEPAYRASIPLSLTRSKQRPCQGSHSSSEAAAARYSHDNYPNEFHNIMEEEMNDIEEWFTDFVDECSSRGECWNTLAN
jgi:hypothetical protein